MEERRSTLRDKRSARFRRSSVVFWVLSCILEPCLSWSWSLSRIREYFSEKAKVRPSRAGMESLSSFAAEQNSGMEVPKVERWVEDATMEALERAARD